MLTTRLLNADRTSPGLWPADRLTQPRVSPRVPVPLRECPCPQAVTRPLRPGTTTKDWKNKELRNGPKGTAGHNSNLIYFDLLAQTFSGPLGPFRIIGCEGWLTLTTSVF